ncbi:FAD-dependent monooxygenase [Stackebrandtia nassauensis]|uniref:Monooxygenase FAD-binding protein n=1 Tax=Stackebrandtia nassauensis (strain DSM 44728 / CIP 108903 / NRRL B-16338 / NBRC 102104 / LLR-40K-21) TaxID=446470 RepID=D3PWW4_STANL|nr:FAD-dependent monooxygenase [Stackebrandtia nassauensis]ADD45188.1 monooxygenase FAD-binding protein [Stackebrandtia nassauensis DSM 44728]
MNHVLVSGASIAGLTTAHWLRRHGFTVTIVERAATLRPGGQAIDVRGVGLDVIREMGLLDEVRANVTGLRGMTIVDADGNVLTETHEETFSGGTIDNEDVELMRDDLTNILHSAVDEAVEFLFSNSIAELTPTETGVSVVFDSGRTGDFDAVVGADGLHSVTRKLAFGPESDYVRSLDGYVGIWTMPNFLNLDHWQMLQHLGDTTAVIYSGRKTEEMRAIIGFKSEKLDYDYRDAETHKQLLEKHFGGLGWEIPNLLRHMRSASDFYFDEMAQIHMDTWVDGRVGLVGDAGYCASPLSGQGTSLALVGGYVLAGELAASRDDLATGFTNYVGTMRPYVRVNQELAHLNRNGTATEPDRQHAYRALTLRDYR